MMPVKGLPVVVDTMGCSWMWWFAAASRRRRQAGAGQAVGPVPTVAGHLGRCRVRGPVGGVGLGYRRLAADRGAAQPGQPPIRSAAPSGWWNVPWLGWVDRRLKRLGDGKLVRSSGFGERERPAGNGPVVTGRGPERKRLVGVKKSVRNPGKTGVKTGTRGWEAGRRGGERGQREWARGYRPRARGRVAEAMEVAASPRGWRR